MYKYTFTMIITIFLFSAAGMDHQLEREILRLNTTHNYGLQIVASFENGAVLRYLPGTGMTAEMCQKPEIFWFEHFHPFNSHHKIFFSNNRYITLGCKLLLYQVFTVKGMDQSFEIIRHMKQ